MKRIPINTMFLIDGQIISYGTDDKGREGANKLQEKDNEADIFWEDGLEINAVLEYKKYLSLAEQ
eukprot:4952775-Ditylum_brightwellii.AAC.1